MATNKKLINKTAQWAEPSKTGQLNTFTYIGIIKNNFDPTRAGRLQVWIPELGGNETDSVTWKTVNYASPFFGKTYNPDAPANNNFNDSNHSYGMWAVPPDIGNQVLCTFVNGDPDRGFWFACVMTSVVSRYMVPGIAAGNIVEKQLTGDNSNYQSAIGDATALPVVEFNENVSGKITPNFYNNPKPVHEEQFKRYLEQGLDRDRVRGPITSSSQRESPSFVFGISTPGRFKDDTADDPDFLSKLERGELSEADLPYGPRKGGHTFVMDDGDVVGTDNLIRLRSSAGHQILMNDDKRVMYISNSEGSVWLEFARNGQMHVYSAGGLNIRTEGDLNLHSDKNINIYAEEKLRINAVQEIKIESKILNSTTTELTKIYGNGVEIGSSNQIHMSGSQIGLKASGELVCQGSKILLNSGGKAPEIKKPEPIEKYVHSDTSRDSETQPWKEVANSLDSICTIVPGHEPWKRQTGVNRVSGSAAGIEDGPDGAGGGGGGVDGSGTNKPKSVEEGNAPQKTIGTVTCEPKGSIVKDGSGNAVTDGSGNPVRSSAAAKDPGPAQAEGQPVVKPCPKEWLQRPDAPNPPGGVGPLSQWHVKCVMTQMGYSESRFDYTVRERTNGNYLGRYQIGAGALTETKYIKLNYFQEYSTRAVRYPEAYYGLDNINSDTDFLQASGVQEKVMYNLIQINYRYLTQRVNGKLGIKPDDDLCTVAGMLCVAQLLGANGARNWRYTAQGADANGSTGAVYFNRGRYAIDVLANAGVTAQGNSVGPTSRTDTKISDAAKKAAAENINPLDVIQFTAAAPGNTGSGTYERFQQCDETFKQATLGFAKEFKEKFGQKLICSSSLRTAEDQAKLYNAWEAAGGRPAPQGPTSVRTPQYGTIFIPLKSPGQHGRGIAMDCPTSQLSQAAGAGLFAKYGLQWLGPTADPPHFQKPRGS